MIIKAGLSKEYSISHPESFGSVINYYQLVFVLQDTINKLCLSPPNPLISGLTFSSSRTRLPLFQTAAFDNLALSITAGWPVDWHVLWCPFPLSSIPPVLGVVPELCQCRDLELDCDGAQLEDIPVVAINVTMMWVENTPLFFFSISSVSSNPQEVSIISCDCHSMAEVLL